MDSSLSFFKCARWSVFETWQAGPMTRSAILISGLSVGVALVSRLLILAPSFIRAFTCGHMDTSPDRRSQ
jgi:hypothetical protein